MKRPAIIYLIPCLVALWHGAGAAADTRAAPEPATGTGTKQSVTAREFMIAAAHPRAARVGYEVLERGGHAVDAMVAVQLMLNLVEPQSSGIGGGAFLLYWDAGERRLYTFDGRETAPLAAGPDYFLDADGEPLPFWEALVGGRSVGVPGTLKLLETVHARFGRRPWADLVRPARDLARRGFEVSPRLAKSIAAAQERELDRFEATRSYFFEPDGTPRQAGTLLRNPDFADTLTRIARDGSRPFYDGDLARRIVETVRQAANPGLMTLRDLERYAVVERDPVCVPYRGFEVCGMGPPTSGGLTVGQILGMLSHHELGERPRVEDIHLYLESAKLAYADRARYMADSDFVPVPVDGLLDPEYLGQRAGLIDPDRAMGEARPGAPPGYLQVRYADMAQTEPAGTSHFVIRDADGNAVSMTSSIETGFGSRLMVGGFLLNNELTDFSFSPRVDGKPVANRVQGGKRPRSSMAPTIVLEDASPHLLIGSPGGSRIINYVAGSLVAILDWGLEPQAALNLGHFVNRNGATELERDTGAEAWREPLRTLGHDIELAVHNSGLHAIRIRDGVLTGAADPRREGMVLGR